MKAAGNDSKDAVLLLIADKLPELVETQAEAIKNIKIDKITVWEGGNSKDGKTSTSNFISGLYQSVPPLQDMFNMAGMNLPNYLKGEEETVDADAEVETAKETTKAKGTSTKAKESAPKTEKKEQPKKGGEPNAGPDNKQK